MAHFLVRLGEDTRILPSVEAALAHWASGSTAPDLVCYDTTKGSLHLAVGQPLRPASVKKLVATRLREPGRSP
jgi:hypothetical protein